MPKSPPPTLKARTRAVVALLAAEGPMGVRRITRALRFSEVPVRRVLLQPLFERLGAGRTAQFQLNDAGRKLAVELG